MPHLFVHSVQDTSAGIFLPAEAPHLFDGNPVLNMSILKEMLSRVKQQVRLSLEKLDDTGADRNAEDCRRIGK